MSRPVFAIRSILDIGLTARNRTIYASATVAREIGIGLLGVGWMGDVHSTSYRRVPVHFPECEGTARLVVASDVVEDRARRAVETLGYEEWTADWRRVIEHPDV